MQAADSELYIGLMSGTSMDSIDAICVDFSTTIPTTLGFIESPLKTDTVLELVQLRESPSNQLAKLATLDRLMGGYFADAANQLLASCGVKSKDIIAIGSHGQTVLHKTNRQQQGYSLQIADPNTIVELTSIQTVADFRRRDLAAGGEGAPLAPAFHRQFFADTTKTRAIINLGGIANITWLSASGEGCIGFDCGPANALLDSYFTDHFRNAQTQQVHLYDHASEWAQCGQVNPSLLTKLLNLTDYFSQLPPKSTGKELFNRDFIDFAIAANRTSIRPVDIQRTLLQFSIETIVIGLQQCPTEVDEIYCCGGGANNHFFLQQLEKRLAPSTVEVATTESLGVAPKQVEAMAFAWLAKRTLDGLTGNISDVTGAKGNRILGAIYQA